MKETYDFLEKAKTYYIATVDDNIPKVRPFGTINIYNDKLYIQTGKVKDVFKQIDKNPYVEICAFTDGEWIRVSTKLVIDEDINAKKSMLDKYTNLRNMYDEEDDNTCVLYMTNTKSVIYSFSHEPIEYNF